MMKNVVIMTVIGIGATMMLSGCGKSAIKCDNGDAQKEVMQIFEGKLKDIFYKKAIIANIPDEKLADMFSRFTFERAQRIAQSNATVKKIIDKLNKDFIDTGFTLTNIRTESVDNENEKSICVAEMVNSEKSFKINITYKLSKTSDGKIYTEIIDSTFFTRGKKDTELTAEFKKLD